MLVRLNKSNNSVFRMKMDVEYRSVVQCDCYCSEFVRVIPHDILYRYSD